MKSLSSYDEMRAQQESGAQERGIKTTWRRPCVCADGLRVLY